MTIRNYFVLSLIIASLIFALPAHAMRVKNNDKEPRTLYVTFANQTKTYVLQPFEMRYFQGNGYAISLLKSKPYDIVTLNSQEYVIHQNLLHLNRYYIREN
jgi:hypothetical protein